MTKTANLAYSGNTEKKPRGTAIPRGLILCSHGNTYFLGYLQYMPGLFFCQVIVDYYTFKVYTVCMAFKFFGGAFMPADSVRINFWIPKDNLELVDAACRRWGVNRTAFINFACMNFLRQEELYYTDNFSAAMMAASQMDEKGVMLIDKLSDKLSDKSKGSGD